MKTGLISKTARLLLAAGSICLTVGLLGCYYTAPARADVSARLAVKAVPASIASVALIVSGSGMATQGYSYTPPLPESISVSVPSGSARTFTILISSVSATLRDDVTVDLLPGESRDITFTPTLAATQIVVPDYLNNRIVQIGDMAGAGWTAKATANFMSSPEPLRPYDVDFDSIGRIYIANDDPSSTTPLGGVLRINDISGTTGFEIVDSTYASGITNLAVDRTNGFVYYTWSFANTLYRKSVDNIAATAQTFDLTAESAIGSGFSATGLAVDSAGFVYFVIPGGAAAPKVVKYDPSLAERFRVVAQSTYTFGAPWGVMARDGFVYVSDPTALKVVRFDGNLAFVDSFGGPGTDPFVGPKRFVAVLSNKITLIDEYTNFGSGAMTDRLVAFDDMTGAGWETFGATGTGGSQFKFYQEYVGP
jgi:hypothetical protein